MTRTPNLIRSTLITSILCSSLLAQQPRVVSPPAAAGEFGNSSSSVMFGDVAGHSSRVQQIDVNHVGSILLTTVSELAWRADDQSAPAATSRTVDLEVVMAHADFGSVSANFAANYLTPPVVVFPRQVITLPDWTSSPELDEFSLEIPFSQAFVYNRQDALLWEVRVYATGSGGRFPNDWFGQPAIADHGMVHLDHRPGCTTSNGEFVSYMRIRGSGGLLDLTFGASGGPSNASAVMLLGSITLQPVVVPGLCAPLGSDGLIPVSLGVTDGTGRVADFVVQAPWSPAASNLLFATQAAALDPSIGGIPVALSNATLTSAPPSASAQPAIGCKRVFSSAGPAAVTGTLSTSAVATRFTR